MPAPHLSLCDHTCPGPFTSYKIKLKDILLVHTSSLWLKQSYSFIHSRSIRAQTHKHITKQFHRIATNHINKHNTVYTCVKVRVPQVIIKEQSLGGRILLECYCCSVELKPKLYCRAEELTLSWFLQLIYTGSFFKSRGSQQQSIHGVSTTT